MEGVMNDFKIKKAACSQEHRRFQKILKMSINNKYET
jgi:hypothetical protein